MGEVAQYRKIVEDVFDAILEDHYSSMGEIEAYKVVDREKGHFIIILEGWQDMRFIYGPSIHVEVKTNGKVWIHRDSSSVIIIDHLERVGIPTASMVVSWHPPSARKHTEFAEG